PLALILRPDGGLLVLGERLGDRRPHLRFDCLPPRSQGARAVRADTFDTLHSIEVNICCCVKARGLQTRFKYNTKASYVRSVDRKPPEIRVSVLLLLIPQGISEIVRLRLSQSSELLI